MSSIDNLDRKILFELDKDSRQSFSKLAKKIGTSQQVVLYRVNRLVKNGVITSFMTSFSTIALGVSLLTKIYIQFTGMTKEKEQEIYDYLMENKDVNWVARTLGKYDLFVGVMVRTLSDFALFKKDFFQKYGEYINDYTVSFIEYGYTVPRNYLINKKTEVIGPLLIHEPIKHEVSEIDKKIMKKIVDNSRITSLEIAKDLNLNVKTVVAKLKDFKKRKIIQGYRININRKKIGMKYYKVFIKLRSYDPSKLKKLRNFCLSQDYLIHFIENIGKYEFELEIEVPDSESMQALVKDIRNNYSQTVDSIEVTEMLEELKFSWLPKSF